MLKKCYYFCLFAIIFVCLPIEEISLRPELSSPPRFIFQWVSLERDEVQTDGWRNTKILVSNIIGFILSRKTLFPLLLHLYTPLYSQVKHSSMVSCTFMLLYIAKENSPPFLINLYTPFYCQGKKSSFFSCNLILLYTAQENTPHSYPSSLYSFIMPGKTRLILLLPLLTPFYSQGEHFFVLLVHLYIFLTEPV